MQNQVSNLDKLTLSNDFLFKHVMLRKRICKHILEELLHTKIADITYLEAEQTLDVYPDSHGIRLDVRIADDTNTHYNLEMQVKNPVSRTGKFQLPKRTRYYQAMLDTDMLQKGQDYDELSPTYIIFFCLFDYINNNTVTSNFTREVADTITEIKNDKKVRDSYMTYEMRMKDIREESLAEGEAKGRIEGRVEGIAEEKLATAKRLLSMGLSVQDVATATLLSIEQVEKIKAEQI